MSQPTTVLPSATMRRMTSHKNWDKVLDVPKIHLNGTETDYSDPIFSSADFMMYCYKVMPCLKTYRHDWRVCPYAHVGETAARRHPKLHSYVGVICPETKKGEKCPRGDTCPCTHSLFEYWLHPTRFKTEFCSRGSSCSRSFCFFAHSEDEVRVFDTNVLDSPMARKALSIAEGNDCKRVHSSSPADSRAAPLINRPFRPPDVSLAGQNIWSMRPSDLWRINNPCSRSSLDLPATPLPGLSIVPLATAAAQYAHLWDKCGSLAHFGSGNSTPPSEIDSNQGNKVSWPDYSYGALNDYVHYEALRTTIYKLLQSTDK